MTAPQLLALALLPAWAGATLLLSHLRWFSGRSLADRLRPYGPRAAGGSAPAPFSAASLRENLGPPARSIGTAVARLAGVGEDLALRLERVHSPIDATRFRLRQLGLAAASFVAAALLGALLHLQLALGLFLLSAAPLLAFLAMEQRLASASAAWQRRIFLELPVVVEQLAMLVTAGWSLGSALNRLAARGSGACAGDLARVCRRIRHGVKEADAVREWAEVARVEQLDRLVPVLAMHSDTSDLGSLLSEEARSIRQDVHRMLTETMERRAQQVWVPVTVAALVPGVIFIAIPFVQALRLFAGG